MDKYMAALGDFADTPLGEAGADRMRGGEARVDLGIIIEERYLAEVIKTNNAVDQPIWAPWVRLGPLYARENGQLVLKGVCSKLESATRASAMRAQAGIDRRLPP
jgi:hypothetical protein